MLVDFYQWPGYLYTIDNQFVIDKKIAHALKTTCQSKIN